MDEEIEIIIFNNVKALAGICWLFLIISLVIGVINIAGQDSAGKSIGLVLGFIFPYLFFVLPLNIVLLKRIIKADSEIGRAMKLFGWLTICIHQFIAFIFIIFGVS